MNPIQQQQAADRITTIQSMDRHKQRTILHGGTWQIHTATFSQNLDVSYILIDCQLCYVSDEHQINTLVHSL